MGIYNIYLFNKIYLFGKSHSSVVLWMLWKIIKFNQVLYSFSLIKYLSQSEIINFELLSLVDYSLMIDLNILKDQINYFSLNQLFKNYNLDIKIKIIFLSFYWVSAFINSIWLC
jgi:hypothetical protein